MNGHIEQITNSYNHTKFILNSIMRTVTRNAYSYILGILEDIINISF